MPSPLRVVLADDHTILRSLLRGTVEAHPDLVVVGEAGSGGEALSLVATLRPDVLVVDVEMGEGVDGVEVARCLGGGPCRVLACSAHDDPVLVAHLVRAGASGFLAKADLLSRLPGSIRAVADGRGRWFGGEPPVAYVVPDGVRRSLAHLAAGGRAGGLDREAVVELCTTFDAVSWYEALARAWGAGLVGSLAEAGTAGVLGASQSNRSKTPGQANSASAMSYGA